MAKKVGLITINLLAGTAEFNTQMDAAKAKIKSLTEGVDAASKKLVTGNQAASGFIRVAEGGMANNLRAVENFMTRTLGLGPAMQAIFPVVGALAFAGLIFTLGEKVYEFFKKSAEGAQRVTNAMRELVNPIRLANDELRVSNDRLEIDIAKLEGKRQNNLQLMLDDARVSADKLGDSLESNLKSLNKLLKEENVSSFWGFITNKAATSDITDYMKAFAASEGEIVDKGQAKIRDAAARKDKPGVDAATSEMATAVIKGRAAAVEYLNKQLEIARGLQADQLAMDKRTGMEGAWNSNTPDQAERIAALRGAVAVARGGTEDVDLTQKHIALETRKNADEAANAGSRLDRPLDNKMADLKEELEAAAAKLAAVHLSEEMKELAVANGEAFKAIEQVNKALKALHEGPMSKTAEAEIHLYKTNTEIVKAEADWQTKLVASTSAIEDRIVSQRMLTAAVGQGYEATKKAAVQYEVMKAVGFEKFNDPKFMADPAHKPEIDQYANDAQTDFEEKHATQVAESIKKITEHIDLEKMLASVQIKGAEAVRLATLALEIQNIRRDESVAVAERMVKAKQDEYAAERGNTAATQLAVIRREIDATQRLAAARIAGAEAARRAELALKYETMKREDSSPAGLANIEAQKREDQLAHQAALTEEVLKTANADRNDLFALREKLKIAIQLKGSGADELGRLIAIRDIDNQILEIRVKELLAIGTLSAGFKAFFTEMNEEAEKPGKILFDGMNSATNALSENLAKLITRQKTEWAQMFKSIGTQMLHSTIQSGLHRGLAAVGNSPLGKKLGLGGLGAGKPDFTKLNPGHVIVDGAGGPDGCVAKPGGGTGSGGALGQLPNVAGNTLGGGFGGLLSKGLKFLGPLLGGLFGGGGGDGLTPSVSSSISFGGALAGGGDMTADKAYIVGDEGPEILHKTAGTVSSNSQSKKLLSSAGGNHFYQIDARGTDPVLTEQRTRVAIMAAHNSAITKGMQVQQEHLKRTPQR